MSLEKILQAIPHRKPMLLLDEIVDRGADYIICRKTFHEDEFFFQGHFPGRPVAPGVILCESAMQAGAVLLSALAPQQTGLPVATRLNDVKFKRMVRPGETIQLEVRLHERLADAFFLGAKITCGGKLAARLEFACAMAAIETNDE
jgi:3-hydroxyacyl-[acyl-carrier-protein] dehydratase